MSLCAPRVNEGAETLLAALVAQRRDLEDVVDSLQTVHYFEDGWMQRRKMVPWPAYPVVTWPFVVIAVWTLCVCSLIVKKNTMLVEQKKFKKTTYLGAQDAEAFQVATAAGTGVMT
jgi:hypothetical protein